jgi:hypothetical protein
VRQERGAQHPLCGGCHLRLLKLDRETASIPIWTYTDLRAASPIEPIDFDQAGASCCSSNCFPAFMTVVCAAIGVALLMTNRRASVGLGTDASSARSNRLNTNWTRFVYRDKGQMATH